MPQSYPGLVHLNGHLLVSVDLETTGLQAAYNEIVQIAVVPLNGDLDPMEGVRPFYTNVRPEYPERAAAQAMRTSGLEMQDLLLYAPEQERVKEMFREWFIKLDLPFDKQLAPLAHNWAFESSFLKQWLGMTEFSRIFHAHARDSMLTAVYLNDRSSFAGRGAIFNSVSLGAICQDLGIENTKAHDALADAIAEAELYKKLIHMDLNYSGGVNGPV